MRAERRAHAGAKLLVLYLIHVQGQTFSSPCIRHTCGSFLSAELSQRFELGSEPVQEVEVIVVAEVAAASHGAGRGAHALVRVAQDHVLRVPPVVLASEEGQLLQGERREEGGCCYCGGDAAPRDNAKLLRLRQ